MNDWVENPRLIFDSDKYGPSFDTFKMPKGKKLRNTKMHSFVETILLCYVHHLPLTLAPDDVWACIIQGFDIHMEKNAEKLRRKFVDFQGKKILEISREPGFILM